MGVKIQGSFLGKLATRMKHEPSQVSIETDPPKDNGGEGKSFSPTDLLATAYGSCMMSIIALAAKKDNVDLTGMSVDVEKHMSADLPRRVIALDILLKLPKHLDNATRSRYVEAARNCPVAKSVHPDMRINFVESVS